MKADIEPSTEELLRAFYDIAVQQAEKIASAVFECAETIAETLAPLITEAADLLCELLPLVVEEIRRKAEYRPTKKDAPRRLGAERKISHHPQPRYCARSQI